MCDKQESKKGGCDIPCHKLMKGPELDLKPFLLFLLLGLLFGAIGSNPYKSWAW
jgi:hypothetical protein